MKLVIFDIDGTLCDSNNIDDECFIKAFKDVLSIDITNTNWDNYEHVTDSAITYKLFNDRFGRDPYPDEIERIKLRYVQLLQKNFEASPDLFNEIDGAVRTVEILKSRKDCTVAIATGSWLEIALLKLKFINFNSQNIFFAHSNSYFSKHDILQSLIEDVKRKNSLNSFDRIIYVGDREYDFRTSQALKIDFVGVDYRGDGLLRKLGVEKVIRDYDDNFLRLVNEKIETK